MGAMTSVSLKAAIEELEHSCLVASMCLLASVPANMEKVLARQAAFLEAVADGLDPVGRTFRAPGGYIQVTGQVYLVEPVARGGVARAEVAGKVRAVSVRSA